jgi:hypothetical protein
MAAGLSSQKPECQPTLLDKAHTSRYKPSQKATTQFFGKVMSGFAL